jgi:hypothetical protein
MMKAPEETAFATSRKPLLRVLYFVFAHNVFFRYACSFPLMCGCSATALNNTCSWISYVVGLLLVLLYAAVSLSTGELKPRGTFIAESAVALQVMDSIYSEQDVRTPCRCM